MDQKHLLLETEKLPEWVNHIKGIDVKAGVEHCDSAEDYLEALEVYIGSVHEKALMLEELVEKEDLKTFTMRIHSLKSMSRLVGSEGLADLSKELEDAGEAEDLETVQEKLPVLLAEYRKFEPLVVHFYKEIPEEPDGAESIPLDMLDDAYQAIDEFALHYDKESIRMVLTSLKEYHLPEMDKARTEVIERALEDNDWAGIRYELNI